MRHWAEAAPVRALVLLAVTGALLGPAAAAAQAPQRTKPAVVTVNDFFFGPDSLTIHKGKTVKWVWSESNAYPHDVHLKQGPQNLKERSTYSTRTTAVTDAVFKKRFERPGTYRYICTIHPTLMKLTLTVRR
ncbi:MAG TPA: plastocyanin/azurin family copper-binding protein [Solirubrobacterales bacterium]|nr:plastocyanin/azurin family copper-binding protein [Solirubrobacterales bacterium]